MRTRFPKLRVCPSWLPPEELDHCFWLANFGFVAYTTVRGSFKMAPLSRAELPPTAIRFLDGAAPHGAYILRYGPGAEKEEHTDPPVKPGQRHERAVCLIQEAEEGGELCIGSEAVDLVPADAVLFRADLQPHSVARVIRGERIVLTVGKLTT